MSGQPVELDLIIRLVVHAAERDLYGAMAAVSSIEGVTVTGVEQTD